MSPVRIRPSNTEPIALLVARVVLGLVFVAHGWQKVDQGVGVTQDAFAAMGVPFPELAAVLQILLELVGGTALVVGLLTPVAGALLSLSMLGALAFVHLEAGLFAASGGFEYVLVLAVAAGLIAVMGAGPLSLDALRRRTTPAE